MPVRWRRGNRLSWDILPFVHLTALYRVSEQSFYPLWMTRLAVIWIFNSSKGEGAKERRYSYAMQLPHRQAITLVTLYDGACAKADQIASHPRLRISTRNEPPAKQHSALSLQHRYIVD